MDKARTTHPDRRVVRLSAPDRQIGDWLALAARRHTMQALLALDVTDARRAIRAWRARNHRPLSLTAFIVACLARAIDENPTLHAHRKGRRDLVIFDDVDVAVVVERTVDGARVPVPFVVRAANRLAPADIEQQIRGATGGDLPYPAARRLLPLWLWVPGPIRRFAIGRWLADPERRRRLTGTTFVSAVGMFGRGTGWGIPEAQSYTLGVTVGSVARKPGVVRGPEGERIEPRDYLALTLSIDHEIVEGAPAARFAARLGKLIEGAELIAGV